MIVLRVLPFVLAASLRNRVRHQLRRLRQPKYALATAVGLAWFWFYAGRHLVAGPRRVPTLPASVAPALTIAIAAGGTALLLLAWIFRARHQALAMSEAEVQFLFPAPLSRVDVLHYRVLQLLAYGLVGTAFTTLVFGRAASGSPLLFALGAWIAFGTADLHRLGIALTWAAVGEGWSGVRRRAGTFGLLAAAVAFTAWAATRVEVPPFSPSAEWLGELARAILDSPLRWPLWPGMALVGLVLSRTAGEFAAHLPGALALLAVHYLWVIRSGVAFEEAAVQAAERRARAREAFLRRRGGRPARAGPRRPPFRLGASGRPEVAFVWKALIATGWAKLAGRLGAVLAVALAALVVWLATPAGDGALAALGPMALVAWGAVAVIGPNAVRADLRLDRQSLDVLRVLPVSGAGVVRGEILGAAAPLVALQWMLLPVAAMGLRGAGGPGAALSLAAGAAALGPALSIVHLVLQNAVVVLLPGWLPKDGERGGPETVGLRLVVAIGGLIALSLLVLPAVGVAGLVLGAWWAIAGTLAPPVIALAAWIAAAVLLAETWLATRLLGSAFDRLDPSEG